VSDIFISYARSTAAQAQAIAEALRALGYGVWRDDEIPANRAYADVIAERLANAKAVVVIWSAEAAKSEWVRSEAEKARAARKLVQLRLDTADLPMPFDQTQCADLVGWSGDDSPGWKQVVGAIAGLASPGKPKGAAQAAARKLSICVLPFSNMSGDPEQEYFSDGISEDIITDLSKVSALDVTARNTAFTFKGKAIEVPEVARKLAVSHVLEGSVRKAGARVRITAQLIDGATGNHLWAERYDRNLDDIFALQDEISEAIVGALKVKLLPAEKKAIEKRGTNNAEAYDLYLMARQRYVTGNFDSHEYEMIVSLCRRSVEADPTYARAWAMMSWAQTTLRFRFDQRDVDGSAAVERALALDPDLAEAHAVRASNLRAEGRLQEAWVEAEIALRLDPDCYEANNAAGNLCLTQGRLAEAIPYYKKSEALAEADAMAPSMLISVCTALGDTEGAQRAARVCLARAEAILAQDRANGAAMGYGVAALGALGNGPSCRDWIRRALLIDPDNQLMRYNFACVLCACLGDTEGALALLDPYLAQAPRYDVDWTKIDPDMDSLRGHPRFQAMITKADARLAEEDGAPP
jgi:adenylate cyclase